VYAIIGADPVVGGWTVADCVAEDPSLLLEAEGDADTAPPGRPS
jgi:hypothetical protein